MVRVKSDLSRRVNGFRMAPGGNPLEDMGSIEYFVVEMRTAGMTLNDYTLYTIFIDALPAECNVEARNLASRDGIGHDDIIKAVRERHHRPAGTRGNGSNTDHASHALFAGGGGGGGRRTGAGGGAPGKGGGRRKGKGGRRGQ